MCYMYQVMYFLTIIMWCSWEVLTCMAMWSGKSFQLLTPLCWMDFLYKSWLSRRASVDLWTVPNCGLNSNLTHFEQFWNAVWCSIDTYFMILLCGLLVCHKYILMISATSTCNNHNLSLNLVYFGMIKLLEDLRVMIMLLRSCQQARFLLPANSCFERECLTGLYI